MIMNTMGGIVIQRVHIVKHATRYFYLMVLAFLFIVLAGCTGMYMGIEAQEEEVPKLTKEQIHARADIHRITPESVQRLRAEMQAHTDIAQARRDASTLEPPKNDYTYLVAPSDVLLVTVWNHPELNNPSGQLTNELAGRTVRSDGTFFYPYIGQVKAEGRTVSEIRQEMATRLNDYLTDPQVDVAVMRFRGRKAYVVGQVEKPGPVSITDDPLYITTLVTQAGGLTEAADLSGVILNRDGELRPLDLFALYYQGDMSQNLLLKDGDIINVPERTQGKVFVLGEVMDPQAKTLPWEGYSLADALGDARGLDPVTSKASQVYVIRAVDEDRPQIWHLDASSPTALVLADNFPLQARDVVYVDAAGVTRWSRVINQILPTATSLMTGKRTFD